MGIEYTLSIIKPDAVRKQLIGKIITRLEDAGLRVVGAKMVHMGREQAEQFYDVHKDKPFFSNLVSFMTSGPVVVMVLKGEGAITCNREVMGATNPEEAAAGTLRSDFAESIDANIVHGSDSPETAEREIQFFFSTEEIFG